MGDTYGAWEVVLANGTTVLVVAKAYTVAKSRAERLYGAENIVDLSLVGSENKAVKYQGVEVIE